MYRVYGDTQSGNCYKVKLMMSHLEIAHEWIDMSVLAGDTRTDAFLAKNPNGKIPVLELESGECLSESNAIVCFLADGTRYLPDDPWARAHVLKWQFFEQYSHEPYIAVARFIAKYLGLPEDRRAEFESKKEGGYRALGVMELQLAKTDFLVGGELTIADISLYAYTHVADEGGFDLDAYPAVRAWLDRVSSHPRHIAMPDAPG